MSKPTDCPIRITESFVVWLKGRHPVLKVEPGVDRDDLMFNAGTQEVITTLTNEILKQNKGTH